eukprot:8576979-Alexandrium_andersonii.AAC.1
MASQRGALAGSSCYAARAKGCKYSKERGRSRKTSPASDTLAKHKGARRPYAHAGDVGGPTVGGACRRPSPSSATSASMRSAAESVQKKGL